MKRYLVTGAAGFIGANFLKYLLKKYEEDIYVVVLDKLTYAGNLGTIKDEIADSRVRFVKGHTQCRIGGEHFCRNRYRLCGQFCGRIARRPQYSQSAALLGNEYIGHAEYARLRPQGLV